MYGGLLIAQSAINGKLGKAVDLPVKSALISCSGNGASVGLLIGLCYAVYNPFGGETHDDAPLAA